MTTISKKKKNKFFLHVPTLYTPECKNFHPEKDTIHSRLKTKHLKKLPNTKKDLIQPIKINPKLFNNDYLDKKKTSDIVATYSLNNKLKFQRKMNQSQKLKMEEIDRKASENEEKMKFEITSDTDINKQRRRSSIALTSLNDKTVFNNLISRTGLKIYGIDKYNQNKVKLIFENSSKMHSLEKIPKKLRRKSLQKLNPTKKSPRHTIFDYLQSDINLSKNMPINNPLSPEHWGTWKYNSLHDEMRINEMENSALLKLDRSIFKLDRNRVFEKAIDLLDKKQAEFSKNENQIQKIENLIGNSFKKKDKTNIFHIPGDNKIGHNWKELKDAYRRKFTNIDCLQPIKRHLTEGELNFSEITKNITKICRTEHLETKKFIKSCKNENRNILNQYTRIKHLIGEIKEEK